MFLLPTPSDFREWQIWYYQKRLTEATDKKAKRFLNYNLQNLKKCNLN